MNPTWCEAAAEQPQVATCSAWHGFNLGIIWVDGAVRILKSLAQPFLHFGRVRSRSIVAVLILIINEILRRDVGKEVVYGELVQRPFQKSPYKELVQDSLQQILLRVLFSGACAEILPRGLLQRSCQESSYKELAQSYLKQILPRDLLYQPVRRSCSEVSYRDLAKRALIEGLCRDL